ncbi:right-handed parallel beta-helix repeat-containing protein [Sphingomonas donggukensis]|uniref:Right-handed parallel beta-helix repeat-containing protein n=1 Tax=Sphingomonas donggukensis TaxID=2949093 RepID=A0ABY4TUN7_9SPHN|nr:right-handed parallel beta-helix repeat-containing protein [Sphingomonas donggukensis]URW76097.1 right-handed parallel beta-helix repeat-containing protein [Sphingomonas donggukensis]
MLRPILLAAAALAVASPIAAQQGHAPFTVQETGEGFQRLDDAVGSIRMGTGTILIAPGTYHECTVQTGGHITFRAATPGSVVFEGSPCEGKAIFVLRGLGSTVDGIIFRGVRVPDGNGAGIRTEMGNLTVTNSMFLDSQEGILGGEPAAQKIVIDKSTFAGLGQCDETTDCSHGIYLANQGSVTVTRSRFERGTGGHYVKVRSPSVTITDNSFDDTRGRKTNYMIDLPEGATGLIARNMFVQGRNKENWTGFIVVAAENRTYRSTGLRIEDNDASLAPGETRSPAFVADYSHDRLAVGANRLGRGVRLFETR